MDAKGFGREIEKGEPYFGVQGGGGMWSWPNPGGPKNARGKKLIGRGPENARGDRTPITGDTTTR